MIHRSLSYHPTTEHLLTRAKWARGFAAVYGTILLLFLAIAAAQHFRVEHDGATTIADDTAARPMRADARPTSAPTAPQAANPMSRAY